MYIITLVDFINDVPADNQPDIHAVFFFFPAVYNHRNSVITQ